MSGFEKVYTDTHHTIYERDGVAYIATNRRPMDKCRVPVELCRVFELEPMPSVIARIGAVLELPSDPGPGPTIIALDVAETLADYYGVEFVVKSSYYTFKAV